MHLCAELIAVSMMLEPLGEVGANFSLQLLSRTQFTKINNKKVIAENQCEKHKKSSLCLVRIQQVLRGIRITIIDSSQYIQNRLCCKVSFLKATKKQKNKKKTLFIILQISWLLTKLSDKDSHCVHSKKRIHAYTWNTVS